MITPEKIKKFAPKAENHEKQAIALESARKKSSVNTPRRLCHFMGQIYAETGGLRFLEESFAYRDPKRLDAVFSAVTSVRDAKILIERGAGAIANRVYANRLGNGDTASGDGWKYRGSGYIQLTGKKNFMGMSERLKDNGLDIPIVLNPRLARQHDTAAIIAFIFWDDNDCSDLADKGDVEGITRRINGPARLGLQERRAAVIRAMGVWK